MSDTGGPVSLTTPDTTPAAGGPEAKSSQSGSLWQDAWHDLRRNPVFLGSAFVVLIVVSWAVVPQLWTSQDPESCDLQAVRQPPKWLPIALPPGISEDQIQGGHWLGTTVLGCDMWSQIVYGAQPSIVVAVLVTAATALIGTLFGILSGYYGGWTDTIISRLTDVVLGLPTLLGALVFLALLKSQSLWAVTLVLIVLGWTQVTRIVRGSVLSLRNQDFVDASRALGASDTRIIFRHILPNSLAPIIVLSTLYVGTYVGAEATLTFIGVGLKPPEVSWGIIIAEGQNFATSGFPHLLIFPCIALIATVLSFILMGDALRDALDPKGR